jgi:DNA invertase Pin-like site-specific DNA recombinase
MRAPPSTPRRMIPRHGVQGLAFVVAQRGHLLHRACSRSSRSARVSLSRHGKPLAIAARISKVARLSYKTLCPGTYVHQMLLVDELPQRGCRVEFVERPMSDDPHDQLLLQIRAAVAEYERTLIAERMRRGRQAKVRSGQLVPWTRAPYGYLLDAERPRDPSRVHLDPVQAAVVEQMFAWYGAPGQPVSLYEVAKRLSEAQLPTPRGGKRWNVASVRGILRSPVYRGIAYSGARDRRQRAAANRLYNLLALGRVSSLLQRTSGLRCQCRPSSARRPSKPCSSVWIATSRWPAATPRLMSIYCVGS